MRLCVCPPGPGPCSCSAPLRFLNGCPTHRGLCDEWDSTPSSQPLSPAAPLFLKGGIVRMCPLRRLCRLRPHLFHELAHGSDMAGRARFTPGLVTFGCLFQVGEVAIHLETFPSLRDNGFGEFPYSKKFATGFEEKIFMQEAVVEQRAGLFPVPEHHPHKLASFRSGCCDSHRVIETVHLVVFEEPVSGLAQTGFAAHFKDL